MPRLTEKNYLSRRVTLQNALAGAKAAHADAAFRSEMGEGVGQSIAEAREKISELEGRIQGLDIAWERTKSEAAADAVAEEAKSASAAYDIILEILEERKAMGDVLGEAATVLARQYASYQDTGRSLKAIAMQHRQRFSVEMLSHLVGLIDGNFNDIRRPISRVLTLNGLDLSDFSGRGFATDNAVQRDLPTFVAWQNARIAGHAAFLTQPKGA